MKTLRLLNIICFLVLVLAGCEKQQGLQPKNDNDFIFAGKIDSAKSVLLNNTVTLTIDRFYDSFSIDINNDSIFDFDIKMEHIRSNGGQIAQYSSTIRPINNSEILTDTSIKEFNTHYRCCTFDSLYYDYNETSYEKIDIPLILFEGDIIDSQGSWSSGTNLTFSSMVVGLVMTTPMGQCTKTFNGWKDQQLSYLGFRIKSENDTIYGWMNVKISDYYRIFLLNGAYK